MTLLSRKADYALLILAHLHHRPEGANARAIADRYGLSRAFVANILKELASRGYLSSHRGVKGGYSLLRPLQDVTLADLLGAFDEQFQLAVCSHGETSSDNCTLESCCPMREPLAEVHQRILSVLRDVRLSELVRQPAPASPTEPTLVPLNTISDPEPYS